LSSHFRNNSSGEALEASQPSAKMTPKIATSQAQTINNPSVVACNAGRRGACDKPKGIAAAKYPPIKIK
jgi:hypothetical protein